jgi:hypothetical protein
MYNQSAKWESIRRQRSRNNMDKPKYESDKQKYEREIEEILAKYEKDKVQREPKKGPEDSLPRVSAGGYTPVRKPGGSAFPSDWRRVSAGQYIAAAFAVALLAVFLRSVSGTLAGLLVIISVVLFLLPIFLYRSTGTTSGGWSSNEQKRWRGQVIDFNTRRDITHDSDPFAPIKRWFRKR